MTVRREATCRAGKDDHDMLEHLAMTRSSNPSCSECLLRHVLKRGRMFFAWVMYAALLPVVVLAPLHRHACTGLVPTNREGY